MAPCTHGKVRLQFGFPPVGGKSGRPARDRMRQAYPMAFALNVKLPPRIRTMRFIAVAARVSGLSVQAACVGCAPRRGYGLTAAFMSAVISAGVSGRP